MKKLLKPILVIAIVLAVAVGGVFAYLWLSDGGGIKDIIGDIKDKITGVFDDGYLFDLEINDETMGSVTVDALDPEPGTVMTLRAKPNYGYVFDGWYVDGESISTELEYTYIMPERDVTMLAVFKKDTFTVKVVSMNPAFTSTHEASYEYLTELSFTADDIDGTEFVAWYSESKCICMEKELTLTVDKDITVYAEYYVEGRVEIYSWPTASASVIGTPLSDVELIGGSASSLGYFKWANPDETVYNEGEYIIVFVPFVTSASELETMIEVPIASRVLDAPDFEIEDGVVTWSAVEGASAYRVSVNESEYVLAPTNGSYTLPTEMGEYYVSVAAMGDGVSTVNSVENSVERYVPPKPALEDMDIDQIKSEFNEKGEIVKFAGKTGLVPEFAEIVEGDVEVGEDYIRFKVKVDVADYLKETTKRKILDLNKFKSKTGMDLKTNFTIIAEVMIYDPTFYSIVDMAFPLIMEDLAFGVSYSMMTSTIVDIDINGEFVEPEQRRGTLHLLFIDLVGLEEPLYKWAKVELPIYGKAVTAELALCFDAVGAIGASLTLENVEVSDYFASLIAIYDYVPVFVPYYFKDIKSNLTQIELAGELDFNINFLRLSASLKLNKGSESISVMRLNLDFMNIESDLSGKVNTKLDVEENPEDGLLDAEFDVEAEVAGSYRVYGQITFEYYLAIRLNFFFLPLDDFQIKIIDGSHILYEWELMKGGLPKTPYKDDAIHITTPIYATDMSVEYFTESDKDFNAIDVGTDYFMGDYLCGFDTEEIVDIDNYYVYALSGSKLRRIGRTAGTERTIAMDVNYILHSDRNYIYYTTKSDSNKIVKLYRSDVSGAHTTFVKLPSGYEAVSMRYDNLLGVHVIYALYGSDEYFFTYDGTNLVRRGVNEHKYWQRLSLGDDIVAYYRLDKNGNVSECFIRTPDGGVTHADSALSIGISELGLFVVYAKEGDTYNYELGLYPVGKGAHSYVKIAEVYDPTTATRVIDYGGYTYFADMNASSFMIYKTDGDKCHPVCITAYGETLGKSAIKAEIHGNWFFIYKYSRGSCEVLFTVDMHKLEIAPYLTNGNHFEFDKATEIDLEIGLSGDATVLGLYISTLSDEEYETVKKGYEDVKEKWETVDKFLTRYCDFWKKKDVTTDQITGFLEEYSEVFAKASAVVSTIDHVSGDLSHGEFPVVNVGSKITVYADDLLAYSYGVHTAYLVTNTVILPVTVEITDSRRLSVTQDTIPTFDKGNPEHVNAQIELYDSRATINLPTDAFGYTERYDDAGRPTGVYDFVFYSHYLVNLPYGENEIILTDKFGDQATVRINVIDTRSPADTRYSKHYDLTYSADVVFEFETYDEKYITKVEGNGIPAIGAYQVSADGTRLTISENYLMNLLPGYYVYTVTTAEKSFDITVIVIESVMPEASVPEEFDLAPGGYFEIDFIKNDAAKFDLYFDSALVSEESWYYSMVDGKIRVDAEYMEKYVPYGTLDIAIRSIIYSGDNVKSHSIHLKTEIVDSRTPTVDVTKVIHTVLDTTPAIRIKVSLYGNRVTAVGLLGSETFIGYKVDMMDAEKRVTYRDGYLVIPATYIVDVIAEGDHILVISIGELEYRVDLTVIDERLPRAIKDTDTYDIKSATDSGDYVIRLFGENFLSIALNGELLPDGAYVLEKHNVNELYHVLIISNEYLASLGLSYSDELEFTVTTSVNSFTLYLRVVDDPTPGGGTDDDDEEKDEDDDDPADPVTKVSVYPSKFSMDVVNPYDVVFSVSYGANNSFGSIKHGLKKLSYGEDYIFNGQGQIVILASYFASVPDYDSYTFRVYGAEGYSAAVTVSFYDSRDPYADAPLSYTYDKYESNSVTFKVHMFDSKVKYVRFADEYFTSGFSSGSNSIKLKNAILDKMPFGTNTIEIGFNDTAAVIYATLYTHDTALYYTDNTNVDKANYVVSDGTVFIPYMLYEGSVTSVSVDGLTVVSFSNEGVTLTGFKNAAYGEHDVNVVANGHKFIFHVTVFDSRKPIVTDEDGIYQFDKGAYEYTLDPDKAKTYDMLIQLVLYDEKINGKDIFGKKTIKGNDIEYEDYAREDNDYLISYLYLYRLPVGLYTFYISTTDGDVEFKIDVTDSRAPYLLDSDPLYYDYAAGGGQSVNVHIYNDNVVSLSYIDLITGNIMLLSASDYTAVDRGDGRFTVNIKETVFERDFYDGYTYAFTLATNTERTLTFHIVIENGPKRPFYVTFYSVPWKDSEPEVLIESQILYEGDLITRPLDPSHEYYHFLGFYTERTGGSLFDFSTPVTDDVNIFLHWQPKTYTVTLVSDGEVWRTIDVRYLSSIPDLPTPTKTGYTFIRWTVDPENEIRFNAGGKAMPHEDITVYAEWAINSYTVIFKHYNGTVLSEQQVYAFEDAVAPEVPEVQYYTFKGWDKFYTEVLSDLVVTAVFAPEKYAIGYELNGGTNPASAPTHYTFEGGVTLPAPTRDGYMFMGWYVSPTFDGARLYEIPYGTVPGLVLYAKWQPVYTLGFDTAGGSGMDDYYVPVGSAVTLPTPERGGCIFLGWYDENGEPYDKTILPTGDITLHAKWERVVVKTENDEVREVTDLGHYGLAQEHNYDEIDLRALSDFFDSRYVVKFRIVLSMSVKVGGDEHICLYNATNGEILCPAGRRDDDMTYDYAVSQGLVYSYKFNRGSSSDVTDVLIEFTVPAEQCGEYMTLRYDAQGSNDEVWYIHNISVEVSIVDSKNTFPINYVLDGGTNPVGAPTTYTVSGKVDLPTPTKAGYSFGGWYTNDKLSGKPITYIPAEASEGFTVYAKWIPEVYNVVLNATVNGENIPIEGVDPSGSYGLLYNEEFELPVPAQAQGMVFCGWYTEDGKQITDASGASLGGFTLTENTVLNAMFERVMGISFIEVTNKTLGFVLKINGAVSCEVKSVDLYLNDALVQTLTANVDNYYRFSGLTKNKKYEVRISYEYKYGEQQFVTSDVFSEKRATVYTEGSFSLSDLPEGVVEYNGHYYLLVKYSTDWNACNQYAQSLGGYLVTLSSAEENAFVYAYIKSQGCNDAYIGFSDAMNEGYWRWANGEMITYTNWHSGEPNNSGGDEDVAHYYSSFGDGTWNDTASGSSSYCIIEWGIYEAL